MFFPATVVSYSISTSNHNHLSQNIAFPLVVSYSISTSNHNLPQIKTLLEEVVSYSISTSNHNVNRNAATVATLYLIPFLHQTTTFRDVGGTDARCILFHFYIKPQPFALHLVNTPCCILFHFYIKPQPDAG